MNRFFNGVSRILVVSVFWISFLFIVSLSCGESSSGDEDLFNLDGTDAESADLIDPEANPSDSRGVEYVIHRFNGDRKAYYVYITPGTGGGTMGYALHLYLKDQMKYAKFMSLQVAIESGNNWVSDGSLPKASDSEAYTEDKENRDEDLAATETVLGDYVQGNIRTAVAPNQYPVLTGYHVNVFVDGTLINTVYKDCNACTVFDEATANSRAQSFLPILQGWSR